MLQQCYQASYRKERVRIDFCRNFQIHIKVANKDRKHSNHSFFGGKEKHNKNFQNQVNKINIKN